MMLEARLRGSGLWSSSGAATPGAEIMGSRLRRRTSLLTKMAIEVATRAVLSEAAGEHDHDDAIERARQRLSDLELVLVSAWGEIETTDALLDTIDRGPGPLSPTRFHNSVHNTATGYLSLATTNRRGSTAMSAGPDGAVMGLLDALSRVVVDGSCVMLIWADESVPESFVGPDTERGTAVAAALWLEPLSRSGLSSGRVLRVRPAGQGEHGRDTEVNPGLDITNDAVRSVFGCVSGGGSPVVLQSGWGRYELEVEEHE